MASEQPKSHLVTWENLDDPYKPGAGTRYELADGCVRVMKRPFLSIDKQASDLMKEENSLGVDTESNEYSPAIRMKVAEIVTEGDDMPDDVDLDIVNRIVLDFFMKRILSANGRTL